MEICSYFFRSKEVKNTITMIGTVENAVPIAGGQMKGISSLNDFHFEPTGIRAWKQSKIGEGKLYNIERRTQPAIFVGCIVKPGRKIPLAEKTKTDCTPSNFDWIPQIDKKTEVNNESLMEMETSTLMQHMDEVQNKVFHCKNEQCTRRFFRLRDKLAHDKLVDDNNCLSKCDIPKKTMSIEDQAFEIHRRKFDTSNLKPLGDANNSRHQGNIVTPLTETEVPEELLEDYEEIEDKEGDALQIKNRKKGMSLPVKQYLTEAYHKGNETKRKMKAILARDYIRNAEDDDGNPLFGKEDIKITEAQIKSFWGRLHAKVQLQTEDPTEEDVEASVEALELDEQMDTVNQIASEINAGKENDSYQHPIHVSKLEEDHKSQFHISFLG